MYFHESTEIPDHQTEGESQDQKNHGGSGSMLNKKDMEFRPSGNPDTNEGSECNPSGEEHRGQGPEHLIF